MRGKIILEKKSTPKKETLKGALKRQEEAFEFFFKYF